MINTLQADFLKQVWQYRSTPSSSAPKTSANMISLPTDACETVYLPVKLFFPYPPLRSLSRSTEKASNSYILIWVSGMPWPFNKKRMCHHEVNTRQQVAYCIFYLTIFYLIVFFQKHVRNFQETCTCFTQISTYNIYIRIVQAKNQVLYRRIQEQIRQENKAVETIK